MVVKSKKNKVKRTKRVKRVKRVKRTKRTKRTKRVKRTRRSFLKNKRRKTQKRKRVLRGGMEAADPKEKESWSEEQIIERNEEHLRKFYASLSDEDLVSLLDRPCSELIISPFPNVNAEVILKNILDMDGDVREANIPELLRLRRASEESMKNKIKKFLSNIQLKDRKSTELMYREFIAVSMPQDYDNEFITPGGRTNEWFRYLFKQIIEEYELTDNLETTHIYADENGAAIDPMIRTGVIRSFAIPSQKSKYSLDDTTKLLILHKIVSRYNNSVTERLSEKELQKKEPWWKNIMTAGSLEADPEGDPPTKITGLPPFLCKPNKGSTEEERILFQLFSERMFAPEKGETDYYLKYILLEKIVPFLEEVGIGGEGRYFDPTEIIQFAIERRLFSESAEEIYRQHTDFIVEQGDLVATQTGQETSEMQPTQAMNVPGGRAKRSDMTGASLPDTPLEDP